MTLDSARPLGYRAIFVSGRGNMAIYVRPEVNTCCRSTLRRMLLRRLFPRPQFAEHQHTAEHQSSTQNLKHGDRLI